MELILQQPTISDVEEMLLLLRHTMEETFNKDGLNDVFNIDEEIEWKKEKIQEFLNCNSKYYFVIARIHHKIVGIAAHLPVSSIIREYLDDIKETDLEFGSLYIDPQFQKLGIGMALFNKVVTEIRNKGNERYFLRSGFKIAQEIWKKKLGDPIYVINDIWGENKNELFWRVELDQAKA